MSISVMMNTKQSQCCVTQQPDGLGDVEHISEPNANGESLKDKQRRTNFSRQKQDNHSGCCCFLCYCCYLNKNDYSASDNDDNDDNECCGCTGSNQECDCNCCDGSNC